MATPEGVVIFSKLIAILSAYDPAIYSKFLSNIGKAVDIDATKKVATSAYISSLTSTTGGTADVLYQVAEKIVANCARGAFLDVPEDYRPELTAEDRAKFVREMKVVLGEAMTGLGAMLTETGALLATTDESAILELLADADEGLPEGL